MVYFSENCQIVRSLRDNEEGTPNIRLQSGGGLLFENKYGRSLNMHT